MFAFSMADIQRISRLLSIGVRPEDAKPGDKRDRSGDTGDEDESTEARVEQVLQRAQKALDLPSLYEAQLPEGEHEDALEGAIEDLEQLRGELGEAAPTSVAEMLGKLNEQLDRLNMPNEDREGIGTSIQSRFSISRRSAPHRSGASRFRVAHPPDPVCAVAGMCVGGDSLSGA